MTNTFRTPGTMLADPSNGRWRVGAVMLTEGERYYMLTDRDGAVALMPATVVEGYRVLSYPPSGGTETSR